MGRRRSRALPDGLIHPNPEGVYSSVAPLLTRSVRGSGYGAGMVVFVNA